VPEAEVPAPVSEATAPAADAPAIPEPTATSPSPPVAAEPAIVITGGPTTTVTGEPPGAIIFAPPQAPPEPVQPAGTESITLVVPLVPDAPPPVAPSDEWVEPPVLTVPVEVADPPVPAARRAVEPVPEPSGRILSRQTMASTPPWQAPAAAGDVGMAGEVALPVAGHADRAAARPERASETLPPPERPQDGPSQPFGLSPVFSGSGGASFGVTLAVAIALLFLIVPPLSRRLAVCAPVWRPGAPPAPLPRPG
jgi:hypothetical protein